jgi:histidyl-tRNA synthetase
MGIERLIALMVDAGRKPAAQAPDVYIVHAGEGGSRFAWTVAETFRDAGLAVILHCGGGSFKSQMKRADSSGARFAAIIGDDEAQSEQVSVKPLREAAQQKMLSVEDASVLVRGPAS